MLVQQEICCHQLSKPPREHLFFQLLTLHRRGHGVDVEALRDRIPLRQDAEKAPRWDLKGTEGCGGGKVVSWLPWMFLGYKSIYRRKT